MKVPLLDLQAQYRSIKQEIDKAGVFESRHFILGPNVEALEKAITAYCGCAYARGVSSGTDALLIALMAEQKTVISAASPGSGEKTRPRAYA